MTALHTTGRANNPDLVRLISDGRIFLGTYGAVVPTGPDWNPSSALANGDLVDLGYYSEDGWTLTPEPGDNTQFKGHNSDIVIDEDGAGTWAAAFSALEGKRQVAEAYFDADIDPEYGKLVVSKASVKTMRNLIIVGFSAAEDLIVAHFPRVKVADREDITFAPGEINAFGMTLRAYKDPSLDYQFTAWSTLWIEETPDAPTISAALPADEQLAGGLVTLTGTAFTGATEVKFGATAAPWFEVDSDTQIRTIMPSGSAGTANAYVTTPGGTNGTPFPYARTAAE